METDDKPFTHLLFHSNGSSMIFNDFLADGKSEPGAGMPVVAMDDVWFEVKFFSGFQDGPAKKRKPLQAVGVIRAGFAINMLAVIVVVMFNQINWDTISQF